MRTDDQMNRRKSNPASGNNPRARIVWRDGPYRIECAGRGPGMKLTVYYGRFVMAEDAVDSAEAAWQRAAELCRELGSGDLAGAGQGSAG